MTTIQDDDVDSLPPPTSSVRLWKLILLPFAVGLGLSFLVVVFQWSQTESARWFYIGLDGMQSYLILGLSGVAVAGVTILAIRPSLRCICMFCAGLGCFLLLAAQVVRIESFNGNRTPRFVWRWEPTAEEKIRTYLTAHRDPIDLRNRDLRADVFTPSDHDYAGFMGGGRNARPLDRPLAQDWEAQPPRLLWRHPVGLGWSSFAIVGRSAVTMEQREEQECVVCYHLQTGAELWAHAEEARFLSEHGDGPRSTPAISDGRVYACGATGIVTCLDLQSGALIWKRDLFRDSEGRPPYFGLSCSPLVANDHLIVTPGIQPGGSIVALDLETGDAHWRSGDDPTSYASPMHATLCGQTQILSFNGEGLRAYDHHGEGLWFQPWQTQGESRVNVAQPVIAQVGSPNPGSCAKVVISSGYEMGTALLKIGIEEGRWSVQTEWTSKHLKAKLSNFVLYQDYIYGLDNGLMTCIRLSDGHREWKRGRLGHGQMLLIGGTLLIQAETGEVVLVAASPEEFRELSRFPALTDKTWNHPALAGNILLVRNDREAAAYELPTRSSSETFQE